MTTKRIALLAAAAAMALVAVAADGRGGGGGGGGGGGRGGGWTGGGHWGGGSSGGNHWGGGQGGSHWNGGYWNGGRGHGGFWHGGYGYGWYGGFWPVYGFAIGLPWLWGWPVYDYPVFSTPWFPASEPAVIVESAPAPVNYWYYCTDPAGYYPYVQQCTKAWIPVVPTTEVTAPAR